MEKPENRQIKKRLEKQKFQTKIIKIPVILNYFYIK